MTVEEAIEAGLITQEEYDKTILHLKEKDRVINKYEYLVEHFAKDEGEEG